MEVIKKSNAGGARPGAGRKKGYRKDPKFAKSERILFACTKDQALKIKERAKELNLSVGQFIIDRCLNKGSRI